MLHQTSFGESQNDPFMAHWHRKPRLRDQVTALGVLAAGGPLIAGMLASAVLIELGEQIRQKLAGRRGDDPFNMGRGKL